MNPRNGRDPGQQARATSHSSSTTTAQHHPSGYSHSSRSPWPCCRAESPRTEKRIDGWLAALEHLAAAGLPTTGVPEWVLRALAARGGRARQVAEAVHAANCPEVTT
jgi:hypothetical protein